MSNPVRAFQIVVWPISEENSELGVDTADRKWYKISRDSSPVDCLFTGPLRVAIRRVFSW